MLSLEWCPGPEEVHEQRECKSKESARAERVQEQRECTSRESARAKRVHEQRECKSKESAWAERVHKQRECTSRERVRVKGVCRWRKGRVAGGRSGVGHRNVLSHWWTWQRKRCHAPNRFGTVNMEDNINIKWSWCEVESSLSILHLPLLLDVRSPLAPLLHQSLGVVSLL